jgi:hypothetical protein
MELPKVGDKFSYEGDEIQITGVDDKFVDAKSTKKDKTYNFGLRSWKEGFKGSKLNENVAVAEVRRAMEAAIAKIKNPTDIERRINNVKFVVYNSLDPNTNGGEIPPSDFQFDDAWWDSTHSQATDSVIASIYRELDAAVKGKSFGKDPMNEKNHLTNP